MGSKHLKEHTYYCCKCDKPFTNKGNLDRHMKSHTDKSTYQCKVKFDDNFSSNWLPCIEDPAIKEDENSFEGFPIQEPSFSMYQRFRKLSPIGIENITRTPKRKATLKCLEKF